MMFLLMMILYHKQTPLSTHLLMFFGIINKKYNKQFRMDVQHMSTVEIFAGRLKALRTERNLSLNQLAKELNITAQSLSLYENAKRTINIDLLTDISKYFDVSADYLVGLSDIPSLDTDLQAVCKYTGLNEDTVTRIKDEFEYVIIEFNDNEEYMNKFIETSNNVICSHYFWDIILHLTQLNIDSLAHLADPNNLKMYELRNIADKLDVDFALLFNSIQCDEKNNAPSQQTEDMCDLTRYRIIQAVEQLSNRFDYRGDYKNYSTPKLLKYLGITNETFFKIKKKGHSNAQHQTEEE